MSYFAFLLSSLLIYFLIHHLVIQKSKLGHPAAFLSQALDPPTPPSVSRAMAILREVGACEGVGEEPTLTPLGHHLALLPMDVRLGKMLVYAAMLGCLQPAVGHHAPV